MGDWSGGAKVSCTSRHRGVQLILAYSWATPAIIVAGKGRRGMFLFLLCLHFHSCSSFFPVLSFISSISFLPFSGRRHKMTHKGWRVVKPQHNQSVTNTKLSQSMTKSMATCLWFCPFNLDTCISIELRYLLLKCRYLYLRNTDISIFNHNIEICICIRDICI